jgi:SulP family sulfate permease
LVDSRRSAGSARTGTKPSFRCATRYDRFRQNRSLASPTIYRITGQIFFASVIALPALQTPDTTNRVVIDVSGANFWDSSGVGALDKLVALLRRYGKDAEVVGYNRASADLVDRFALHDKTEMGIVPH